MKLLRTIRLDPSDTFVFERAAEPGEWAVTGSFLFADDAPKTLQDQLEGKARSAFRSGFLGAGSFGWSTLVQIVEADDAAHADAVETLAQALVRHCGAPDVETARPAAIEEIAFAASLCDHPADTLVALHRRIEDGELRETFRTLRPKDGPAPLRAFAFLEVADDDEPGEHVDLASMAKTRSER